ncbi:hypothetical protein QUB80_21670 [Chlorogloeopsis sp. ULAP01]|uniref:hypothetical protein n=1 Tax=Chlorogloeopsis sp. ULAP01 TaxID=3056483 RepID=UPI0025AB3FEB|nr:hypothetical protein [Chlorogloeopsis sp. ULAP01]MDM9383304.1 hypothetical protein [Chlorogloeopsis sp. ULAP01]
MRAAIFGSPCRILGPIGTHPQKNPPVLKIGDRGQVTGEISPRLGGSRHVDAVDAKQLLTRREAGQSPST